MNLYFVPYLLLAFFIFFLYLNEIGKIKLIRKKQSRWIAYITMWFFIGLRGHIMSDFVGYYAFFQDLPDLFKLTPNDIFFRIEEPGFIIYTSAIKLFTNNYFVWVAINTLIDFFVFAWFFHKYSRSMILPLIFFIAFNGLLMEFNLYRNVKAIELFLLSIPYLQKRKILPYMLLNILGVTFHTTSLIYLPLYFILTIQFPLYVIWIAFLISNMIFLMNISIIGDFLNNLPILQSLEAYDKITRYASNGEVYKLSFGYIERLLSFILFIYIYKRVIKKEPVYIIFYNCFFFYYFSTLIFYEVVVFSERIPYLFMFSYWIIYPKATELHSRLRTIIRYSVSLLVIMKIIASYNTLGCSYSNVLFSTPDYEKRKQITEQELQNNK